MADEPGADAVSAGPGPGVRIHTYEGFPPSNETLVEALGIGDGHFLYLTATAAQAGARRDLAPAAQRHAERGPQIVFHQALRHLMDTAVLTRSEQRIMLQRKADVLAAQDESRRRQLRHDAEAWTDVLSELDAQGIDLGSGVPVDVEARLVHPGIADLMVTLQSAVRGAEHEAGRLTFEHGARRFLDEAFDPPPAVVLEGFTFLTPLQRHFVERCSSRCHVRFVVPYRDEQERAFSILRLTYDPWWDGERSKLDDSPAPDESALGLVRHRIFAQPPADRIAAESTITVQGHPHRHHEVGACIERIRQLCLGGRAAKEIAIVTRNPDQYRTLLQEEAGVRELAVHIGVPPRLLLLTPLGRFVLSLYEVRDQGPFVLTAERFQTILASGWLGARAQASADRFSAVIAQVFSRCSSREDWDQAFDSLEQIPLELADLERLPSRAIHADDSALWRSVVDQVDKLSGRLFGTGPTSIAGHVRLLLESLESLSSENLFAAEREIVDRIRQALEESASATTLAIDAAEFGEILVALARQYEEAAEGETPDQARIEQHQDDESVWVTTPEGIDGIVKPVVIYLGLDESRVPRPYADDWPLAGNDVPRHLDLERYLFAAVVRAAREELHLSYALADAGGRHEASSYVDAIRDVVVLPAQDLPADAPAEQVIDETEHLTGVARRERYSLSELAQYGLCPFRYKLERLDQVAGVYREEFQVHAVAQAAIVTAALADLRRSGLEIAGTALLEDLLAAVERQERVVRGAFRGIRPLAWRTIKGWARRDLEHLVEGLNVGDFGVRIVAAGEAGYEVVDGDRVTYVDASPRSAAMVGRIQKAITRDRQREEWLIWKAEGLDGDPFVEFRGLQLFDSRYRAVRWWSDAVRYAYAHAHPYGDPPQSFADGYAAKREEVALLVHQLEQGRYPRRPGDHCRYCPVERECLGLDP